MYNSVGNRNWQTFCHDGSFVLFLAYLLFMNQLTPMLYIIRWDSRLFTRLLGHIRPSKPNQPPCPRINSKMKNRPSTKRTARRCYMLDAIYVLLLMEYGKEKFNQQWLKRCWNMQLNVEGANKINEIDGLIVNPLVVRMGKEGWVWLPTAHPLLNASSVAERKTKGTHQKPPLSVYSYIHSLFSSQNIYQPMQKKRKACLLVQEAGTTSPSPIPALRMNYHYKNLRKYYYLLNRSYTATWLDD